jgi:hypothetical protein
MMCNGRVQLRFLAIACALLSGPILGRPATAGLLLGHGQAALSGIVPLLDSNAGNFHYGDVEYAVFNPLNFANAFPGEDTPNGGVAAGEVVYAYQVIDNGGRAQGITQFSAGLSDIGPPVNPLHFGDGLDDNELVNIGDSDYIAGTGVAPNHVSPIGSSVPWKFLGASAIKSGDSAVLFYTSPFGPTFDNGSTTTGAGQSRIPAPEVGVPVPEFVPEPSTFALVALGLLGLAGGWRRR